MLEWSDDLRLSGTDLYLDSRRPRGRCFISHAHSDHLGCHELAISTPATAALTAYRLRDDVTREAIDTDDPDAPPCPPRATVQLPYGQPHAFDADTTLRLHPAGHILGSAMLHVTRPEGTLLYTGDLKLRPCLTAEPAAPVAADVLVTESTYGLPLFRFPPREQVIAELLDVVTAALRDGRQSIVMGYSLGKAQEITRVLTDAGVAVTCHGAVFAMNRICEQLGTKLGTYRRYAYADFHGPAALDLAERGVLVAPPNCARSGFVTRFKDPCRVVLTGWAMLKNAKYRYGVDHALPVSDHADYAELLELIERVRPRRILTHHGYPEFVEHLRALGHDAALARPPAQLSLFE